MDNQWIYLRWRRHRYTDVPRYAFNTEYEYYIQFYIQTAVSSTLRIPLKLAVVHPDVMSIAYKYASIHTIKHYPYIAWNYKLLLERSCYLTCADALELCALGAYGPELLSHYSSNPSVRYWIIQAHPHFPWDVARLRENRGISMYMRLKHNDYFHMYDTHPSHKFLEKLRYIHVRRLPIYESTPVPCADITLADFDRAPLRRMHKSLWNILDNRNRDVFTHLSQHACITYFITRYYDNPEALCAMQLTQADIVDRYKSHYKGCVWPKIPLEFVVSHPEFEWNYVAMYHTPMYGHSIKWVYEYPHLFDPAQCIGCAFDMSIQDVLHFHKQYKVNFDYIIAHPNITPEIIAAHPELPWDHTLLCRNANVSVRAPALTNPRIYTYGQIQIWKRYAQRDTRRRRATFMQHYMAQDHPAACVNVGHLISAYLTYI
jgi:hypothetical protein